MFARAGGTYGDETIFLSNADGSGEQQLTPNGESCCVRFSPDGTQVLYSTLADDGLRITAAIQTVDDGTVRSIPLPDDTANFGTGAWSPDGQRLALQLWDETDPSRDGIYSVRAADGGDLVRLTDPDVVDLPGDFSPDGASLAIFREGATQGVGELFLIDVEGPGDLVRLSPEGMHVGYGSVRFSPDGTQIVFQESRVSSTGALYLVAPDGSGLRKVFEDAEGRYASHPAWSPDGTMIIFALNPVADDFEHRPNALYVIDAHGTNLQLVKTGGYMREPEWRNP